ncbi:DBIRD complex subunit ZNF326-like isoform X2 [Xiphias gladius]|uniref:DBIRD complex subunit ZNF326-like isoform X2 n=1 Tax=Xiphias gladius TaxID=8245 RepID=UPI001A99209E|nr:DBIRD complex subunit ZNF326-like isoform X2 [Xiphias gladius]
MMNRQNHVPFSPSAAPKGAAPLYKQLPGRVPKDFIEAMKRIPMKPADNSNIRTTDMAAKPLPTQKPAVQPSAGKWMSSFKPVGEEEDNSQDKSTSSSEKVELYDPYDPGLPESELRIALSKNFNHSTSDQDINPDRRHLSPGRETLRHWNSTPGGRLFDTRDFSPETRPGENRLGQRLPERRVYSPDNESLDRPGYGSISRPLDHRVCSPDRMVHGSSNQQIPATYGGRKTNGEERITVPEHRREMTTTVTLSPPKLQQDYQHHLGFVERGLDQITPATEVTRNRSKTIVMDKSPITCDLCDVELANGQELEDHLDSKSHWGTLEHIQQKKNYDDLAIAFLQEVMLYKSRQCSRAIEDSALQALQENDHMTKVEMFHCAACNAFISTSASLVQTHITSQEHLSNTKEFELQQRRTCLSKAETIMKELKPQFEHFMKGDSPFE